MKTIKIGIWGPIESLSYYPADRGIRSEIKWPPTDYDYQDEDADELMIPYGFGSLMDYCDDNYSSGVRMKLSPMDKKLKFYFPVTRDGFVENEPQLLNEIENAIKPDEASSDVLAGVDLKEIATKLAIILSNDLDGEISETVQESIELPEVNIMDIDDPQKRAELLLDYANKDPQIKKELLDIYKELMLSPDGCFIANARVKLENPAFVLARACGIGGVVYNIEIEDNEEFDPSKLSLLTYSGELCMEEWPEEKYFLNFIVYEGKVFPAVGYNSYNSGDETFYPVYFRNFKRP